MCNRKVIQGSFVVFSCVLDKVLTLKIFQMLTSYHNTRWPPIKYENVKNIRQICSRRVILVSAIWFLGIPNTVVLLTF